MGELHQGGNYTYTRLVYKAGRGGVNHCGTRGVAHDNYITSTPRTEGWMTWCRQTRLTHRWSHDYSSPHPASS